MKKLYKILIPKFLIVFLLCLAQIALANSDDIYRNFFDNQGFSNPAIYDFKIGDLVIFRKNEQGILLEGKITEINQNKASIDYVDPDEPTKVKEYVIELSLLTKIESVKDKSDLELNMQIIFKKNNSEKIYEGIITGINQTNAVIEFIEPSEPTKTKEYVSEFNRLYKVVVNEVKVVQKPETNIDFKIADFVKFKKLSSNDEFEGKIIAIKQNIAEVEYIDPAEPSKTKSIEKNINDLEKIEKITQQFIDNNIEPKRVTVINPDFKAGDKVLYKITGIPIPIPCEIIETYQNTALVEYGNPNAVKKNRKEVEYSKLKKKEPISDVKKDKVKTDSSDIKNKEKPDYLRHTIAVDGLQFAFNRASIWYEYKPKELIGIRFPFYMNWSEFIYSIGINPKFYFNKNKIIKGFAGPEIIGSYKPYMYKYDIFYLDFLADAGISINPIKNLNITLNCGVGINIDLGMLKTRTLFSYYPEVSIGYNF